MNIYTVFAQLTVSIAMVIHNDSCSIFRHENIYSKKFITNEAGVMSKSGCEGRLIYDMEFCVKVCERQVGQSCSNLAGIGEDVCTIGTYCFESTCIRLADVTTPGETDHFWNEEPINVWIFCLTNRADLYADVLFAEENADVLYAWL